MQYLSLLFGLIMLFVFLSKRTVNVTIPVVVIKGFVSLFFISFALLSGIFNDKIPVYITIGFVIGAVFGLIGDILLDLKYVYKKFSNEFLYSGFTAFLIGHIFYSSAMIVLLGAELMNAIGGLIGAVALMVFVPVSENLLGVKYREFMKITIIYMGVLGFTVALSVSYIFTLGLSAFNILLASGFLLFLLSDALLSGIYFSLKEKDRTNRVTIVLNHLFYYAAQFMIAGAINFFRG